MFPLFPVYLRTTPEVVYERMKIRGRDEESTVSFEYLKELHDLHENWLIHGLKERPAPVSMNFKPTRFIWNLENKPLRI